MRMLALGATGCAVVALATLSGAADANAKDNLTIGVAQFPASLHPYISSQTVQFFTIGFATRPITAFDVNAKPTCLLCTELPTLENGLAKIEDLGGGKQGLAVTIKLKPELKWGDGVPVTANDLLFTWKIGPRPRLGLQRQLSMVACHLSRCRRRPHGGAAPRPHADQLSDVGLHPARTSGGADPRAGRHAARLHQPHALQCRPHHQGPVERPVRGEQLPVRQFGGADAESRLGGVPNPPSPASSSGSSRIPPR